CVTSFRVRAPRPLAFAGIEPPLLVSPSLDPAASARDWDATAKPPLQNAAALYVRESSRNAASTVMVLRNAKNTSAPAAASQAGRKTRPIAQESRASGSRPARA